MHKFANNKKTYLFLAFLFMFSLINQVNATSLYLLESTSGCNGVMDPEVVEFFQGIFDIFKYGGPLLCVVLTIVDFTKSVASQDKDFFAKSIKRAGKRVVLALILFFVPSLINFVFDLLGWTAGTCGIG